MLLVSRVVYNEAETIIFSRNKFTLRVETSPDLELLIQPAYHDQLHAVLRIIGGPTVPPYLFFPTMHWYDLWCLQ